MRNLGPRDHATDIACIADIPVIAKGTAAFAGSGSSTVIDHGLSAAPTGISITPIENPAGNLGEFWAVVDASHITVYNTGSATTDFMWIAII